jgi:hypothetical protein
LAAVVSPSGIGSISLAQSPAGSPPAAVDAAATRVTGNTGAGGGAQADFDTLIDLIESTIAPDTWEDVGGDGSIQGFPGGVYVDASGVLRQLDQAATSKLSLRWQKWNLQRQRDSANHDTARFSPLRKVSLVRLLALCQQMQRDHLTPTDEMLHLAGLEQINYVMFDADRADCVVAGPAGPWKVDRHGRHVGTRSGRPVVRLEDLIVLLNNAFFADGQFLCAITPTPAGLAQAQHFITQSGNRPLPAGASQRDQWLQGLRSSLGLQRITVEGIDANTRVARVIVEADHHMKCIGIGLEPGTQQVPSYLDGVAEAGVIPEQLDVLRWWFTLHPQAVGVEQAGQLYAFDRQAVQVLSENELLIDGQRVHTGQSNTLNSQFARDFTRDFRQLARIYPVYADLDNIFRLSLVAAIIRQQGFPSLDEFDLRVWLKAGGLPVTTGRAPMWVESIVNHRQVDRRRFVAAVSGGVRYQAPSVSDLPTATMTEQSTDLRTAPPRVDSDRWWWD